MHIRKYNNYSFGFVKIQDDRQNLFLATNMKKYFFKSNDTNYFDKYEQMVWFKFSDIANRETCFR